MSRIPIRIRVTLAFAVVMALVLVALGLFVYLRQEHELNETIDQGLESRADDVAALVGTSEGGLGDPARQLDAEESFAQVLTPSGEVADTTPQLAGGPVLSESELAEAESQATF